MSAIKTTVCIVFVIVCAGVVYGDAPPELRAQQQPPPQPQAQSQPQPQKQMPGWGRNLTLPEPTPEKSAVNFVNVVGWPEGRTPTVPKEFTIARYGPVLSSPRWLYELPNGDVLVAEASTQPKPAKTPEDRKKDELMRKAGNVAPSANRITLLRDPDGDGRVDSRSTFLANLSQPFGMVLVNNTLFVANTDGVIAFPYQDGQTRIEGAGKKIVTLPAGGYNNHWTRNIITNNSGTKLYITVGSASNVGEHGLAEEEKRAAILECNLDGSGLRVFASGLRNPNGMDWEPSTDALWTVVNERDGLGDDLVPDYLARVEDGGFYGWPFSYFGQHVDPRVKPPRPELVARARVPDYGLGSHTASLGLAFSRSTAFPERYRTGAFIGQHGSWNRSAFSGFKVIYVAFKDGQPTGPPEDFVTGFLSETRKGDAYGRPVGVIFDKHGALLVADDVGNSVWRVAPRRPRQGS
jgi:glucose/arabinose dehydrogenase